MDIEKMIEIIANKYNFIQQRDVIKVENSVFDIKKYKDLHNKTFISINNHEILFGKLFVNIDKDDDEEEYYYIDKNIFCSINWYVEKEDTLLEIVERECKKYNLL